MASLPLRSRVRGALLGACVGDALGAPLEGASPGPALQAQLEHRAATARHLGYTDDTEMLIGLAESLVASGGLDLAHLARTLHANYEPVRGYGRGMKLFFQALERGVALEDASGAAWASGSFGNGAAVRVAPLACLRHREPAQLAVQAAASAQLTHRHPRALAGCLVQASALGFLLRLPGELEAEPLLAFLSGQCPVDAPEFGERLKRVGSLLAARASDAEALSALGNSVSALESVPLALLALLREPTDFRAALLGALSLGGDTDSIGALTGALAGALHGEEAIPPTWLAALEDGARGRSHLRDLADRLAALAGS